MKNAITHVIHSYVTVIVISNMILPMKAVFKSNKFPINK